MVQTEDRKRIDVAETNIGVLQSDAQATAVLLRDIAGTLKELTAKSTTPPSQVFAYFASGVVTASIMLAGLVWLIDVQVTRKTDIISARLDRVESALAWTPSFVTIRKGE